MRSSSPACDRVVAVLAAALAVAGCNQLFGLDPTVTDTDGDGVLDDIDVCPTVADPDQTDTDGDGVGDACSDCANPTGLDADGDGIDDGCDACIGPGPTGVDSDSDGIDDGCDPCIGDLGVDVDGDGIDDGCDACTRGPPHDEDTDGIAYACDDCPHAVDPGQDRTMDADEIGDVCDPRTLIDVLAIFDGFAVHDPLRWPVDQGWTETGDALVVTTGAVSLHQSSATVQHEFLIETKVASMTGTDASSQVTLSAAALAGRPAEQCTIDRGGTLTLNHDPGIGPNQIRTTAIGTTGPMTLRLSVVHNALTGADNIACEVTGQDSIGIMPFGFTQTPLRVGLMGIATDAAFAYIWAATAPP